MDCSVNTWKANLYGAKPNTRWSYRMEHGWSFKVITDMFGVSQSLVTEISNNVIKCMVLKLYDQFACLPRTEADLANEYKGFIENYECPCVGTLDGFHVHVTCLLRNYCSFKSKHTITSIGLITHNKRFLHLTTDAPGSTHVAWLLRYSTLFVGIQSGGGIPNKYIILGDFGEIPLVTTDDTAFSCLEWLLKCFNRSVRHHNKVTENAYGMVKGRWRIIYEKCESRLYNIKYVIIAVILLHIICVHKNLNQDGDWVFIILSWLIQNQTEPNTEIVSDWLWEQKLWLYCIYIYIYIYIYSC